VEYALIIGLIASEKEKGKILMMASGLRNLVL
jgi:hypothetical protein